ncbi:GNAT family N-acetyltransferase [Motilimonas eburnea]|uniref:GNAT family N-acetyltransferase n=1 Tax=Motilimonas eburnea TaxID=1737488 RepID=UPI001E40E2B3|nr:GNAT family N-acetyltransferase [Motilimonas eburnea]MCE2571649.1 GNAT family N-acetyltransferase [Motilimonas eburnea]
MKRCPNLTTSLTSCVRLKNGVKPKPQDEIIAFVLETQREYDSLIELMPSDFRYFNFVGHPFKTVQFQRANQVIGFASYYLHSPKKGKIIAELAMVYVLPAYRGNCLGGLLSAYTGAIVCKDVEINNSPLEPSAYFPSDKEELSYLLVSFSVAIRNNSPQFNKPSLTIVQ